ncbi:MAG: alpha/beta fold hydrolase [Acidimicrobiia bacterium]|nr:alpha/beta fold hydrolase [Acidimicrobiia bacterium]
MTEIPPIRFAPAREARIAYQVFGDGPVTLVAIPPMAQNIEIAWERPEVRRMFDRFASFSRFLHFDKRSTGASDRRSHVPGIDERVDDLRAVMDHAGVDRAHFFAASEGGPMAILFAATFPDRVESMTLFGSGPSLVPPNMSPEERTAYRERQRRYADVWGTTESPVVDGFAPSLASDQGFRVWHRRYERAAASTDSLRDLLELTLEMDVREVLPELDLPVLVLHRKGDRVVPVEWGRELADNIAGARLVELDGEDHFGYAGDVDVWMTELERFVTGEVKPRPEVPSFHPTVRIETLGRFAVIVNDEEVPVSDWGSRRARQLLKRLVTARGWPVTRDHLCDILWPDESDRQRLGARLSVQLSAVRRVLGGGVIASRESVQLDLDEVETDLERFYAAADDGAVVAAYGGEFLPEDLFEDWAGPVRDEVRARFVASARRLAQRHVAAERHSLAAEVARRLLVADKYDEHAHVLLVESLLAAGEPGEAERAHEVWETTMAELGVAVEPFRS